MLVRGRRRREYPGACATAAGSTQAHPRATQRIPRTSQLLRASLLVPFCLGTFGANTPQIRLNLTGERICVCRNCGVGVNSAVCPLAHGETGHEQECKRALSGNRHVPPRERAISIDDVIERASGKNDHKNNGSQDHQHQLPHPAYLERGEAVSSMLPEPSM